MSHTIKIAADTVRDELAEQISKSSSDADDDDWTENSFATSYSNKPDLQNLLKFRPSEAYAEAVGSAPATSVFQLDNLPWDAIAVPTNDSILQAKMFEETHS